MSDRLRIESIDRYMAEVASYERISTEEEIKLSEQMKSDDYETRLAARNRLICANLRLVVKIAHDFKNFGLGFADLVSEGNNGLMLAADKFDPSHGAKFSCYAAWWIKQSMRRAIAWQTRVVRIPGGSAQKLIRINKAAGRLRLELGREPTDEEVAKAACVRECTVGMLRKAVTETLSMDETVNEDSATTFDTFIAETKEDDSDAREQKLDKVREALGGLSGTDRTIVEKVFGIGGEQMGLQAIAMEVGLTMEDVQHRIDNALTALRGVLTAPAM